MASHSTRSLRRPQGIMFDASSRQNAQNNTHNRPAQANTGCRKRARDSSEERDDIDSKRSRITLEIEPRSKVQSKKRSGVVINTDATSDVLPRRSTHHNHTTTRVNEPSAARTPKKHADKVVAGIKHELDRLQPSEADKKDEKRKLRSQESSRFKSDLSLYFPDYDVVIGNEPEETHFLNVDTPIIIIDSNPSVSKSPFPTTSKLRSPKVSPKVRSRHFPSSSFENLHEAQRVDFAFLNKTCRNPPDSDPLADTYYEENGHRRQERLERSIRNTEKGRAQHERDQVIRILGALQGHDWLKVMGVSGITESKRKEYEPARDHFIRGCQAIVEKFRSWREEEKRRKLEKERALVEAEAADGDLSDGDPPDYSDVDHAAAQQLHEEAISRSAPSAPPSKEKQPKAEPLENAVEQLEKDFVSFYSKPYLREAAIGKHRRSGRSVSAWGKPIPEIGCHDFDLPEEYRTKDTLEANARARRRHKRVNSKD